MPTIFEKELLLASKSPRRRQLLSALGIPVSFVDIDVDETIPSFTPTKLIAQTIAIKKASAFNTKQLSNNQVLVTADTIVVCDGEKLGKPRDRHHAEQMLRQLSNKTHSVFTGVCLKDNTHEVSFSEQTLVTFKALSDFEIDYYLNNFQYIDKAGSYGIQDWIGMVGVSKIDGCYYNVMGLPLTHLWNELLRFSNTEGKEV